MLVVNYVSLACVYRLSTNMVMCFTSYITEYVLAGAGINFRPMKHYLE